MHSTEDFRIFDDKTQHLVDFDIASQASLLAGSHSSQGIEMTTTFASLSDEHVEDLKLLAQYYPSFLGDLRQGFDESEKTPSSPDSSILIATPVPLPYSARSSEVLESMISGPKETLTPSLTLAEKLEREHTKSPILVVKVQDEDTLMKHDSIRPAAENHPVPSQAVFRPIRPVSPSTLIALTEPCLMAWSTRLPLRPFPAQILHSKSQGARLVPRQGAQIVPTPAMHSGCNSWGY